MMNLPERCETGLMPLGDSRGSFCVWTKEKPRECGDKILSQQSTAFFYGSPPRVRGKSDNCPHFKGHPCKRREVTYVSKYYDVLAML